MSEVIPIRAEVGARIRAERRRLGLNQADFGRIAGVSRRTQAGYEAGEVAPDAEYLLAISLAGVDVLLVITGQPGPGLPPVAGEGASAVLDEASMSQEEARLVDRFRRMPRADQAALQRLAGFLADRAKTSG